MLFDVALCLFVIIIGQIVSSPQVQTLDIILKGFLTGLMLSFSLGAVFFALIQNSIKGGYKTGIAIASGVILSDVIFVSFALLGTSLFSQGDLRSQWVQLIAISFLLFLGIYTFINAKKPLDKTPSINSISFGNVMIYFGKGFLLNGLNPANFFAWTVICTYTTGTLGYTINNNILFFSFALLAIFLMESAISFGAHSIKRHLTDKIMLWVNRISGSIYIAVAIWLIITLYW